MSNSRGLFYIYAFGLTAIAILLISHFERNALYARIDALKEHVAALEAAQASKHEIVTAETAMAMTEPEPTATSDDQLRVGDVIPTEINAVETVSGDTCWVLNDGSFIVEKIDGEWALVRYDRQGPAPRQPRFGELCPDGTRAVRPVIWLEMDKREVPKKRQRKQEQREAARRLAPS